MMRVMGISPTGVQAWGHGSEGPLGRVVSAGAAGA